MATLLGSRYPRKSPEVATSKFNSAPLDVAFGIRDLPPEERAKAAGAPHVKLIVRPGKGHDWGDFWRSAEDTKEFADWFDLQLWDRGD